MDDALSCCCWSWLLLDLLNERFDFGAPLFILPGPGGSGLCRSHDHARTLDEHGAIHKMPMHLFP